MSSNKLRKYLAYYRKTLSEDPENIEARLRLAALFREMGRHRHAIEEYGTAAKLLASEGLPLEAIAACKAILELDSTHRETQMFLARLYAQVPEATDDSVRVARPVGPIAVQRAREEPKNDTGPVVAVEGNMRDSDAITLEQPKAERPASGPGARRSGDTKRQAHPEREWLRRRAMVDDEDDRETFELDVFDMESLGLENESSGQWDKLDIFDDVEEPNTQELAVSSVHGGSGEQKGQMQREFRVSSLPVIPLFSQLPRKVFVEILDAMELEKLPAATEVLRPDDPESCLYVVVSGKVRVEKDLIDGRTVELATLGEGQIFGEFRLLTGRGGRARVVAHSDVELLSVSDEVLYRVGREYPELWNVLWDFYFERMLNHSLASSPIFATLNREERELVMHHFQRCDLAADTVLFARGDDVDALSLIVRGRLVVEVPEGEGTRQIEVLEEGALVGVSPCAREVPATATVRTETEAVLYQMEGEIFRELMYGLPEIAEAVRELVRIRQARTPELADDGPITDRI